MGADRSDAAIVGRLIQRTRLLIALSEEIPTETKLNAQALLKLFERALESPDPDTSDQSLISSYYQQLYVELQENADVEALLSAMKVFLPYL